MERDIELVITRINRRGSAKGGLFSISELREGEFSVPHFIDCPFEYKEYQIYKWYLVSRWSAKYGGRVLVCAENDASPEALAKMLDYVFKAEETDPDPVQLNLRYTFMGWQANPVVIIGEHHERRIKAH